MANHTVSEVAAMARVSVRTLHHYHEIGLLDPAHIGANGYRYYGREELLRLQQILIHRALGIPPGEIAAILDAPGFDRLAALREQRARIAEQAARSAAMLRTIDRTIADLEGNHAMNDHDLYSGIVDPEKQAEYEAWLERRHGPGIRDDIADGRQRIENLAPAERDGMMAELAATEQALAAAMRDGVTPDAIALDPLVARHFAWVKAGWGGKASPAAYAGLADMYLAHPDFVARYERIAPGFALFLAEAMRSWATRQ